MCGLGLTNSFQTNSCDTATMPRPAASPVIISAVDARRVLLHLQGLTASPTRSSAKAVQSTVERLGYVQIDSINVLERAHHMILGARLNTIHNLYYYQELMSGLRAAISAGELDVFVAEFHAKRAQSSPAVA